MKKMTLLVVGLLLTGMHYLSYAQPIQTKTSVAKYISVWSLLGMTNMDYTSQFTQDNAGAGSIYYSGECLAYGDQVFFPSANTNTIDYDDYNPTVRHLDLRVPLHEYC